jgi:hypothetical protein
MRISLSLIDYAVIVIYFAFVIAAGKRRTLVQASGGDRRYCPGCDLGDKVQYARSLGLNVNLIWGGVLLIFGLCMLLIRGRERKNR